MSRPTPCVGQHALFDSTDERDHAFAARLCARCPLLDACADRLADTVANAGYYGHPEGTWAGQLVLDGNDRNLTRRLARTARATRIEAEDDAYTDSEARAAHNAYAHGDTSTWAATGHRVYGRRRKQSQRMGVAS